jgi:hypothetical protein
MEPTKGGAGRVNNNSQGSRVEESERKNEKIHCNFPLGRIFSN